MNHFCSNEEHSNIDEVKAEYPGATSVIECTGGWMVFDTAEDETLWLNQK